MLMDSGYDRQKMDFLIDGFSNGFDLGYRGPQNRQDTSANLPFSEGIGNPTELWNKVMKEVKFNRYAGPFKTIPYNHYIQSPIGLVPKAGNQTRLIFHLSYDFKNHRSFNHHTPSELCSVKYNDLDHAVRNCLNLLERHSEPKQVIWLGITDLKSAFRVVPGRPDQWKFLLMKARHPTTGVTYYFADKCLPFGASISCSLYNDFSNALAHIICYYTNSVCRVTNYLDDFLFISTSEQQSMYRVRTFIQICKYLGVPIAEDKIVWPTTTVKFLGVLINGENKFLQIPHDKKDKALFKLMRVMDKRTVTVREIQELTGLLNFLAKVIIPGRVFTRRMYTKISDKTGHLKQYHHITLDKQFKDDASIWVQFLINADRTPHILCRPFVDLSLQLEANEVDMYTDSSANGKLGFGGIFLNHWFFGQWNETFIKRYKPSIQYLELYAVCMAVFVWIHHFRNYRLILHCDNLAVVNMLNNTSSGCPHCLTLLKKLMVKCLEFNTRIFAQHVEGSKNSLSDSLSRLQFNRFLALAKRAGKTFDILPEILSDEIWPLSKIW